MRLSAKGAAFIGRFEGFRAEPYNDPVGHATVGFGHLIHFGRVTPADRKKWGSLTRAEALELLREDAEGFEACVRKGVKVKLNQAQFDALVSLAFNIGCNAFAQSSLLKKLNVEDRRGAADGLLAWCKAGGRTLEGLLRRRREERTLFLTGRYDGTSAPAKSKVIPFAKGPSKSFTWLEVHKGRGISAVPRARAILHARKMEQLRAKINIARAVHGYKPTGINILSWYRPRWYNEQIGGATNSRHISGDACDISREEVRRLCPWKGGAEDFDFLCNRLFAKGGFGQYPAGSRHVDSRGYRARWTSF